MPRKFLQKFIIFIVILSLSVLVLVQFIQTSDQPWSSQISAHAERMHEHLRNILSADGDTNRASFFELLKIDNVTKKDWHDHVFIDYEAHRKGLGEQGVRVVDPKIFDETLRKAIYAANGYDGYLSDRISLFRSVPDLRHPDCKTRKYLAQLPTASVIVPFWNENFSTLMRTAISCLRRAPAELLLEVILVNDFSDHGFTWNEMNDYVVDHFDGKIKVIHFKERRGLMAARMAGAREAKGDVLVFLDAHTEANVNWLPPLLEPIAENYRISTVPFVDDVDVKNYEYRGIDAGRRGTFNWEFLYKRIPVLPEDRLHPSRPFKSPIMNGGLFAISAKFFWELGGYDEGIEIWGGEQFDISFKIWMCHGAIYDVPCSHFGHLFRYGGKAFPNPRSYDYYTRNVKRVAEVWMDEYKEVVYKKNPDLYAKTDAGDLSKPKAIREKLHCKSFKWYLENVAIEVLTLYPPNGHPVFASGAIKSVKTPKLCIDSLATTVIGLYECGGNMTHPNWNQRFKFSHLRDISQNDKCWDLPNIESNSPINLIGCHEQQGNQLWRYVPATQMITKEVNSAIHCVDSDFRKRKVFINLCDEESPSQKWILGYVNETMMADWRKNGAKLL